MAYSPDPNTRPPWSVTATIVLIILAGVAILWGVTVLTFTIPG